MKLIKYEIKFKKGTDLDNLPDEATTHMFLLDIAHSLSILAETISAQYEQSKGLISASQSMLESTKKELAKLSDD